MQGTDELAMQGTAEGAPGIRPQYLNRAIKPAKGILLSHRMRASCDHGTKRSLRLLEVEATDGILNLLAHPLSTKKSVAFHQIANGPSETTLPRPPTSKFTPSFAPGAESWLAWRSHIRIVHTASRPKGWPAQRVSLRTQGCLVGLED